MARREGIAMSSVSEIKRPRVLLFGYNGANNTGAEAKLLATIEEMRALIPDAVLTVPSLDVDRLRRYLREADDLRIVRVPTTYRRTVRRLVKESDLVVLVEGSCYIETFTKALLDAYLWATRCAHEFGKPCVAYAVDSGHCTEESVDKVRRDGSLTDLIIMRTRTGAERMRAWGVTAPIKVAADTALLMRTDPRDADILERSLPGGTVGIAAVDFFLFPVVPRPWGRRSRCYKWPYYFAWSRERRRAAAELAQRFAELADRFVKEHDRNVALLCMESVDDDLAKDILARMKCPERARIFSATEHNASQMASVLRSLDLLVTSRYHAGALSLEGHVPQIAIAHDVRLADLYDEIGMKDEFFFERSAEGLWPQVRAKADRLLNDPGEVRAQLAKAHEEHVIRAKSASGWVAELLREKGWSVGP
ncbi:MAG: polysaccharide pyruvyl transferase family protein [Methanomassiliicoccus sp.]|nr:polysaccharide pyruvyl transferase family protein [Methanomassiliicoccus sp.]